MLKEKETPGMITIPMYTTGKELKGYPPKEKKSSELKVYFITSPEVLKQWEMEGDIMTLCEAKDSSLEQIKISTLAKKNGITDIPAGRSGERDEGR